MVCLPRSNLGRILRRREINMLMKQLLASLLLVMSSFTFINGSTWQTEEKLTTMEKIFQEAVGQRTSPFATLYGDHKRLPHIETLLLTGRIGAEIKGAALATAVSYGDIDLLHLLIRYGANVNHEVENGRTILMMAAAHGFYVQCVKDTLLTSNTGNTAAVKALLDAGSQLDTQNHDGDTALMLAARYARNGSVELLLSAGANVNLTNAHCETALMHAVEASGGYAENNVNEIVMRLISGGANLNARDEQGKTALSHAPRSGAVTKMLIAAGAIE
jgi:hypothetical protein